MSDSPRKQRQPGPAGSTGDSWAALARELASNPDSPASLRIMSAVSGALRPSRQAIDQLVLAYCAQIEAPGPTSDAAVLAAEGHWEAVCQVSLGDDVRRDLQDEAARTLARRARMPPAVESVVAGLDGKTDTGYDQGVHLQGLRGTWHRLWAAIALGEALGDSPEQLECISEVKAQFEALLGRALEPGEFGALTRHAHAHGRKMAGELGAGAQRTGPSPRS